MKFLIITKSILQSHKFLACLSKVTPFQQFICRHLSIIEVIPAFKKSCSVVVGAWSVITWTSVCQSKVQSAGQRVWPPVQEDNLNQFVQSKFIAVGFVVQSAVVAFQVVRPN